MDVIPSPIQTALSLFEGALADLRFADIDAKTLARAAADVNEVATVVASAQAALDSARAALEERQMALLEQVQRAIAYARVYAENDEALRRSLDAIRLPRPGRPVRGQESGALVLSSPPEPSAAGRRGRPRKASAGDTKGVADPSGGPRPGADGDDGLAAGPA